MIDRATFQSLWRAIYEPLERRIALAAIRVVTKSVKDSVGIQGLKVVGLTDEVDDDATEHMQPGGLTHVPMSGSEGVSLSICGVRDDAVVVCVSHRKYRPKGLQDGETALYNDGDKQSTILLKKDGSVVATSGGSTKSTITMDADGNVSVSSGSGKKVTINAVEIDSNGNLKAPGEITAKSGSPGTSVTLSQHKHPHPMGPTSSATPGT